MTLGKGSDSSISILTLSSSNMDRLTISMKSYFKENKSVCKIEIWTEFCLHNTNALMWCGNTNTITRGVPVNMVTYIHIKKHIYVGKILHTAYINCCAEIEAVFSSFLKRTLHFTVIHVQQDPRCLTKKTLLMYRLQLYYK